MASFLSLTLLATIAAAACSGDPRPVIGLLMQPSEDGDVVFGDQYVPASYVKWIESAGARVALIPYDTPQSTLQTLMSTQLNGLLWPGGGSDIDSGPFADAARFMLNEVMTLNSKGTYFPLWGTCQGFEMLCIYIANNSSVLVSRSAENTLYPLYFTPAAANSVILGTAPEEILLNLESENITVNNHEYGVSPTSFTSNAGLANTVTLLSTNYDLYGYTFGSMIEGKMGLPIWGSQFHPEKPAYEWDQTWSNITGAHSADAVAASQYFINFFVNQARKSPNCYTGGSNGFGMLVYNFNAVYTLAAGTDSFEQCYFVNNTKSIPHHPNLS